MCIRDSLLERLWDSGGNFIDDHTLTVTMNRLRAKIEDDDHPYIKTVRGMGYILSLIHISEPKIMFRSGVTKVP